MLALPAFCVPTPEAANLNTKRQAQLEWMQAKGIRSLLSTPVTRHVTWADVGEPPARTVPAQHVAERCVAALHSLRRLNAKQLKPTDERASGQAA